MSYYFSGCGDFAILMQTTLLFYSLFEKIVTPFVDE